LLRLEMSFWGGYGLSTQFAVESRASSPG